MLCKYCGCPLVEDLLAKEKAYKCVYCDALYTVSDLYLLTIGG